jgi:hypothetical protein
MKLADLIVSPDILGDAKRLQDDLGQEDEEFLVEILETAWNRVISSEDSPATLRVRFPDDRACMRYVVELLDDQLRYVETQADS